MMDTLTSKSDKCLDNLEALEEKMLMNFHTTETITGSRWSVSSIDTKASSASCSRSTRDSILDLFERTSYYQKILEPRTPITSNSLEHHEDAASPNAEDYLAQLKELMDADSNEPLTPRATTPTPHSSQTVSLPISRRDSEAIHIMFPNGIPKNDGDEVSMKRYGDRTLSTPSNATHTIQGLSQSMPPGEFLADYHALNTCFLSKRVDALLHSDQPTANSADLLRFRPQ